MVIFTYNVQQGAVPRLITEGESLKNCYVVIHKSLLKHGPWILNLLTRDTHHSQIHWHDSFTYCNNGWQINMIFLQWTVGRVQICLKILYSNFLFIHHEAEVGIWFYIVKKIKMLVSWNLCSKMSKMWSILLRDTVKFAPWPLDQCAYKYV